VDYAFEKIQMKIQAVIKNVVILIRIAQEYVMEMPILMNVETAMMVF
jgi:hypothetical protein